MSTRLELPALEALRRRLEHENCDVLLVTAPSNFRYLTGLDAEGAALVSKDSAVVFVSPLYAETAAQIAQQWQVRPLQQPLWNTLAEYWRNESHRVGFETQHLPYSQYQKLVDVPGVEPVPTNGFVEDLRMVKSKDELRHVGMACRITRSIMDDLESRLQEGMTERDLWQEALRQFYAQADGPAFTPIVLFGERTSLPHGGATDRALQPGDVVLMDVGARVGAYCADLTSTVVFGPSQGPWPELFDLVSRAQKAAIKASGPGVPARDVDRAAREIVRKAGYGEQFIHGTGHGVGRDVHERPVLNQRSTDVLEPGMVVTVEPGVYFPGQGGVRLETMIHITQEGGTIFR